ncbi:testis-specific gene A8 protein-like [Brachypodium distachyon]|uniref:testis-specific gene A8 protein-like n=1 Tax=Brachypodium distachyon TaxID=15368 RepID=UPI00052FE435|nr:testis-specific gene A8 protein-like [Brachypodium distachyon]|eukprot:XP_010229830.1 testis-specific gene A8 protein-like [Brachypodium distachyon]
MVALRAPVTPGSAALLVSTHAFLHGTVGGESPLPLLPALVGESVLGGLCRSAKPRKTPRADGAVGARGIAMTRGIAAVDDEAAATPGAAPGVSAAAAPAAAPEAAAAGPLAVVIGVVAAVAPETTAGVATPELPADVPRAAAAAGVDVAAGEDTTAAAVDVAAAAAYALDRRTIRDASSLSSSSSSIGTTSWDAASWPASSSRDWREGPLISDSPPLSSSTCFPRGAGGGARGVRVGVSSINPHSL